MPIGIPCVCAHGTECPEKNSYGCRSRLWYGKHALICSNAVSSRIILTMLWVLAGVEVVLWIYGMATGHRMGGVLNFLLLLAAIAIVTELLLRWRRSRTAQRPLTLREQPTAKHKKAA